MVTLKRTQDGRYIGLNIIEITSFPDIDEFGQDEAYILQEKASHFLQLVKEFRTMCIGSNAVMELLWVAESIAGQVFKSDIRIFMLVRELGDDKESIVRRLDILEKNFVTILKADSYRVKGVAHDEVKRLFLNVESECVYALKKKEKSVVKLSSQTLLHYVDVLEAETYENMNNLVIRLSELKDCAVSFQIMPVNFTVKEKTLLGEITNIYNSGKYIEEFSRKSVLGEEPAKSIKHYYEKMEDNVFNYNIVIFGNRSNCSSISSCLTSIMHGKEQEKVTFELVDLKALGVKLYYDLYTYPLNIHTYMMKLVLDTGYRNYSEYIVKKLSLVVSNTELLCFFKLPLHTKHTLALKSDSIYGVTEQLSNSVTSSDNMQIGTLIAGDNGVVIGAPKYRFTRHALVVGAPGTGKTTCLLNLLLQFNKAGIPFLAIEPTKAEYRALIDKIPEIQIFTPGNSEVSPFIINPFIPPRGVRIEQYKPVVIKAFSAAFSMGNPLDILFKRAVDAAYIKYGWRDYSRYGDEGVTEFGLYEFIMVFKKLVKKAEYDKEFKGRITAAGTNRLLGLITENRNIFDSIRTIPIEHLLTKPTVIELNAIQDVEQKALIMALLLTNVCIYTELVQRDSGNLKNVMLIDEAHVLLDNSRISHSEEKGDAQGATIKKIEDMIAAIRALGTGIIIADQMPSKVGRAIISNTDIKIVFRLVEKAEKEIVASSINADALIEERITTLKDGEAFVFWPDFKRPQIVKTPDIKKEHDIRSAISDEEIKEKGQYWKDKKQMLRPYRECEWCSECDYDCNYYVRADAHYYANHIFLRFENKITNSEELEMYLKGIDKCLENVLFKYRECDRLRLVICCAIQLRRIVQLETNIRLSDEKMLECIKTYKEE